MPDSSLPPTKWQARIRALSYLFASAAGVWVLTAPPRTIEGIIGSTATVIWGVCLIPAAVAAVAAWRRKWRVEYAILPLVIAGTAIYAGAVWADVPWTITRGPQACMLTALAGGLLTRFLGLHRLRKSHDDKGGAPRGRWRGVWNKVG